jgi:hypothetical protein
MHKLGDILPLTIQSLGLQKKYNIESALIHWSEIVGQNIASHSSPIMMQRGILLVAVNNSVWCHHLSMMKEDIMSKMNTFVGEKLVSDIRFQAGNLKNYQNEEESNDDDNLFNQRRTIRLSEVEANAVEDIVLPITDERLQQKIARIVKKNLTLNKAKKQQEWKPCAICSTLCPPGYEYCMVCNIEKKEQTAAKIRKVLIETPWLNYQQVSEYIPCTLDEYSSAKTDLIGSIVRDINLGQLDRIKAITFIMLNSGAKPEAINDVIIAKTLEKFRRKKNVFTPGS